jgi:hypothetical protein
MAEWVIVDTMFSIDSTVVFRVYEAFTLNGPSIEIGLAWVIRHAMRIPINRMNNPMMP